MDKIKLVALLEKNMSSYKIAKHLDIAQTTVRYWINKHGLQLPRKRNTSGVIPETKVCSKCSIEKSASEFYTDKRRGLTSYCKDCNKQYTAKLYNDFKQLCVDYKGGKCENCGYNTYTGAMDFHHIDPNKKDFAISKNGMVTLNTKLTEELDKCALLCANCHREVHGGLLTLVDGKWCPEPDSN